MSMVKRPTLEQMSEIVASLHMSMSDHEVGDYLEVLEGTMQAYDRVDALPDYLPEVRYPRTPGSRPSAAENPLGAWYVKSEIKGAPYGPLAGKRVVLKDNICLAGVPMMNGASTLEGYVPDVDATVATRILDAGGTIAGKAHCEYFCLSGGSHTSASGPVHNPYKLGYSAGGSSSGCAALVGAGEIEMAIGGDQGGSVRMPGSFSGVYGMKPTHGLVPYTGAMPIEATIDHLGPMTGTVADNALLLEVIAGPDGLDPRQYNVRVDKYTAALGRGVAGLRIGVLTEGFQFESCEPDVVQKVRQAAERLSSLGAIVEEVSIPMHVDGLPIWTPIALEGLVAQMMHGNGMGFNWEGLYTTSLLDAHANWRARANQLSRTLKVSMMAGEYFIRQYRGHFYAKAQNLSRLLRKTYDQALTRHDLLLMPTTPMKATPIPAAGRAARALLPARLRDAAQHRAVRRQRPPGDERAVRHVGGAAGRHAAGRRALRRVDDLPRRARLRAARRLAQLLARRERSRGSPWRRIRSAPTGSPAAATSGCGRRERSRTCRGRPTSRCASSRCRSSSTRPSPATARATRRSSTPRSCACRGTT